MFSGALRRLGKNGAQGFSLLDNEGPPFAGLDWFHVSGQTVPPTEPTAQEVPAGIVRQSEVMRSDFLYWMTELKETPSFNRKKWEWFLGLQNAFAHFGGDFDGKRAIGFGVGLEPIPDLLAKIGFEVLATDYREGQEAHLWADTEQLSATLLDLNSRSIASPELFSERVTYRDVDMNNIPDDLTGAFDFVFSFCSLGHIGGYHNGLNFVRESTRLLKPGGLAVHTTELDLSTRLDILESPALSLYRAEDLQSLVEDLVRDGFDLPEHSFTLGPGAAEQWVDREPWSQIHLRLDVLGHDVVPFGIVVKKPMD